MRGKGITYYTGFIHAGASTHEPFDPDIVKREMRVIHDDLYCNAVRITGGDPDDWRSPRRPVPPRSAWRSGLHRSHVT